MTGARGTVPRHPSDLAGRKFNENLRNADAVRQLQLEMRDNPLDYIEKVESKARAEGRKDGFSKGYDKGVESGFASGYDDGFDGAVAFFIDKGVITQEQYDQLVDAHNAQLGLQVEAGE